MAGKASRGPTQVRVKMAALEDASSCLPDLNVLPTTFLDDDVEQAQPASKDLAKHSMLMERVARKQVDESGRVVSVRPFPFWTLRHDKLGTYGVNVAFQLLLSFQLECVAVLVIMFLLHLPQLIDNRTRNVVRDACRDAMRRASAANASAANAAWDASACGYAAANVRMSPPKRAAYLTLTLGACEEFVNGSSLSQPALGEPYPFVAVPDAPFCLLSGGPSGAMAPWVWWLSSFGGTCCFLVFVLRLRRLRTVVTREHDRRTWTVADYAVMIEGLARGREPDELEATLREDLLRVANVSDDDLSHIEIGCGCGRERRLLQRIAGLRVRAQELSVRIRLAEGRAEEKEAKAAEEGAEEGAAPAALPMTRDRFLLGQTRSDLAAARSELDSLRGDDEGHVTTGQAFVVFQLESKRNEFLRLFEPSLGQLGKDNRGGKGQGVGSGGSGSSSLDATPTAAPPSSADGAPSPAPPSPLLAGILRRALGAAATAPAAGGGAANDVAFQGPARRGFSPARPPLHAQKSGARLIESLARGQSLSSLLHAVQSIGVGAHPTYRQRQPRLQAADGREVDVSLAPEPEDVIWENLEVSDGERLKRTLTTYVVTVLIVGLSATSFYFLTAVKARGPDWIGARPGSWARSSFSVGLSLAASSFVAACNLAIKQFVYWATARERHVSTTRFERSLFSKLALAYVANTVALPWLIGAIPTSSEQPFGVSQGWYEAGGPVEQAQNLLLTGTVFEEAFKLVQPYALFQRYVLSRRAASQLRLNALWSPPPMAQGEIFASAVKQMALVLLFAPLYPPLYLLGALSLLCSLAANKFSLSFWWGRPPWVGAELMDRLRNALEALLPFNFATAAWAAERSYGGDKGAAFGGTALPPLLASASLWLLLQLLRHRGAVEYLVGCGLAPCCVRSRWYVRAYDGLEPTTDGIRYDDVPATKGCLVARYRGLAATRADEGQSGWSSVEIEQRAFHHSLGAGLAGLLARARDAGGRPEAADAPSTPIRALPLVGLAVRKMGAEPGGGSGRGSQKERRQEDEMDESRPAAAAASQAEGEGADSKANKSGAWSWSTVLEA